MLPILIFIHSYKIQVNAKLDRGFFKAEQNWTCYRRNYFQVSATFNVQGTHYPLQGSEIPCLLRKGNEMVRVDYFSIGIFARVANYDKKIELVQHTPKRDKGPQMIPQPRPVRAGGNLHLASIGSNQNIATFERLQFKTATANNGKRRAAQQYYEIVVDLYANTNQEEPIRVASCSSAQLVVRGRSPGHYADSHTRFRSSAEHFSSPPYSLPNSPPHDVYSPPYPLGHFPPPPPPPPPTPSYGSRHSAAGIAQPRRWTSSRFQTQLVVEICGVMELGKGRRERCEVGTWNPGAWGCTSSQR